MPNTRSQSLCFTVILLTTVVTFTECKKNSNKPTDTPVIVPAIVLQNLAGQKTFLVIDESYSLPPNSNWYRVGTLSEFITVIDSSTISISVPSYKLAARKINDSTYEFDSPDFLTNTSQQVCIRYTIGSNLITFFESNHSQYGTDSANGREIINLAVNNPYQMQNTWLSSDTGHFGDTIQYATNAPANASYYWYFTDGTSSTLAKPIHTYSNIIPAYANTTFTALVKITVNDSSYILKSSNDTFMVNPRLFAGNRTWSKHVSTAVSVSGTTLYYRDSILYDTSFALSISQGSVVIWNNKFQKCSIPNEFEVNYCGPNNYTFKIAGYGTIGCSVSNTVYSGDTTFSVSYFPH